MFTIVTARENYSVDGEGNIGRPAINMKPSGQWKALSLVRYQGWGMVERVPFSAWKDSLPTQWRYKNGKPRYHLRDLDHGTVREWGAPVECVYKD